MQYENQKWYEKHKNETHSPDEVFMKCVELRYIFTSK